MNVEKLSELTEHAFILLGDKANTLKLKFLFESLSEKILRYCKLRELSPELETILVEMTADRYRKLPIGTAEEKQTVASVTDGQQSVSFRAPTAEEIVPSTGLTQSEMNILNEYRRLWW